MPSRADGARVALLIEDGFDEKEVHAVIDALRAEGAAVVIVGPFAREYRDRTGVAPVTADLAMGKAHAKDFDAVFIPGGFAPDRIRMRHAMIDLVTEAIAAGTPVATIDRGPQVLISANALRGRTVTCWPSIAIDVKNAGGLYVDRPLVRDGCIFTSRKLDDLPTLISALVEALGETRR